MSTARLNKRKCRYCDHFAIRSALPQHVVRKHPIVKLLKLT